MEVLGREPAAVASGTQREYEGRAGGGAGPSSSSAPPRGTQEYDDASFAQRAATAAKKGDQIRRKKATQKKLIAEIDAAKGELDEEYTLLDSEEQKKYFKAVDKLLKFLDPSRQRM